MGAAERTEMPAAIAMTSMQSRLTARDRIRVDSGGALNKGSSESGRETRSKVLCCRARRYGAAGLRYVSCS